MDLQGRQNIGTALEDAFGKANALPFVHPRRRRRDDRVLWKNGVMTGVQFVTDTKGRKIAVLIDLKKHGARLQDFWGGLVSESRRGEVGIPFEKVKADILRRG